MASITSLSDDHTAEGGKLFAIVNCNKTLKNFRLSSLSLRRSLELDRH